jgi:hypothetical protein
MRSPLLLRHQPGQAAPQHVVAAARHLGLVGRVELKGAGALQHGLGIDGGDGGKVGIGLVADEQIVEGFIGVSLRQRPDHCWRVYNRRLFSAGPRDGRRIYGAIRLSAYPAATRVRSGDRSP